MTADRSFRVLPAAALVLAMAATRIHHFGIDQVLPDASVAVFFLAGLWIGSPLFLAVLLAEAFVIDATVIGWANVPAVCVTPGYAALIPAYAALWFAGRTVAGGGTGFARGARIGIAVLAGTAAFFLVSNLGYYLGGGFAETHGAAGFSAAVAHYFPFYLATAGAYVAAGVAIEALASRYGRMPQSA